MCTLFSVSRNNKVFAALNYDCHAKKGGTIYFQNAGRKTCGFMLTSRFGRLFPFEGMNQDGLYIGQTAVPVIKRRASFRKPYLSTSIIPSVLEKFSTVDRAVDEITSRSVFFAARFGFAMFHFMIADADGASAIIEFINGIQVVRKKGDYQLMTNFYVTDPSVKWKNHVDGCGGYERFRKAESKLRSTDRITHETCADICRASVTQNFRYDGNLLNTLWSGVYDLANRDFRLYTGMNYEKPFRITLHEELKKGTEKISMDAI